MGGKELEQLHLPNKEILLSPPPEIKIIAITASPIKDSVEIDKQRCLIEIQEALESDDTERAKRFANSLGATLLEEEDHWQSGSSPTILAGESARTCYSSEGILFPQGYLNPRHAETTDQVIESTRKAGHLTTRQHAHFVFGVSRISRMAIHDVFHNHPFYNSEQVSQRYVAVKEGSHTVPAMKEESLAIFQENAQQQIAAYNQLREILKSTVAEEYYRLFPARENSTKFGKTSESAIAKKAQEVARYVLGIDTHAFMYHSVSALTLMRYSKASQMINVPPEAKIAIGEMVKRVAEIDPKFLREIEDPLPLEETPEFQMLKELRAPIDPNAAREFVEEFDLALDGKTSNLIGFIPEGEAILALAVRTVLGISKKGLSDQEAISWALDPSRNKALTDNLNLTTMSPISKAMHTLSYTFAKRLSHTADSQDQRHRMTPGPRPVLATHYTGEPDFLVPELIGRNPEAMAVYQKVMEETFTAINKLFYLGEPPENALLRLPNAFPVRFTEGGDLLNFRHKALMRLCFNAQREIYQATQEEVSQVSEVHPNIGKNLLAPCGTRKKAKVTPFCPEGNRFCGVTVWRAPKTEDYPKRLI